MTEMAQDVHNQEVSAPANDSNQHENVDVKQERTFTQSELNEIVGRNKRDAVESYKRKLDNESRSEQQAPNYTNQHSSSVSKDDIRRLASEEASRLLDERTEASQRNAIELQVQKIAQDFLTKVNAGKSKYPDYEEVMKGLEYKEIPHIVQLASNFEDPASIMYDLRKNPEKIGSIYQLLQISPQLAYERMQELAQSIKDNEVAAKTRLPNEPLSQLRPSHHGTGSGGEWTVSKARSKYRV